MSTTTENYKYTLPSLSENYSVVILNENFRKIDEAMKEMEDANSTIIADDIISGATTWSSEKIKEANDDIKAALEAADNEMRGALEEHKSGTILDHPNGSVTTEKIANGAVTPEKVADGAVTTEKIYTRITGNIDSINDGYYTFGTGGISSYSALPFYGGGTLFQIHSSPINGSYIMQIITQDSGNMYKRYHDTNSWSRWEQLSGIGRNGENDGEVFNDYRSFVDEVDNKVGNKAIGSYSHAEGEHTQATNSCAHSEGKNTIASGFYSHAENCNTRATGLASHSEGNDTEAAGTHSHAEGDTTQAKGRNSHAEGERTIATSKSQHVQGKFNIEDTNNKYAHIVGNGSSDAARNNAHTLDWDGNAWYQGNIKVGGTSYDDEDARTVATTEYVKSALSNVLRLQPLPEEHKDDLNVMETGFYLDTQHKTYSNGVEAPGVLMVFRADDIDETYRFYLSYQTGLFVQMNSTIWMRP